MYKDPIAGQSIEELKSTLVCFQANVRRRHKQFPAKAVSLFSALCPPGRYAASIPFKFCNIS